MSESGEWSWDHGLYEAEALTREELGRLARWAAADPVRRVAACPCALLAELAQALRAVAPARPVGVCAMGFGAGRNDGGKTLREEIEAMTAFDEMHGEVGELWAYEAQCQGESPDAAVLEDLDRFVGVEVYVRTADLEAVASGDCIQAAVDWPGTARGAALLVEAVTLDVGLRIRNLPLPVRPERLLEALAAIEAYDWSSAEAREFLVSGAGATIEPAEGRSWLRAVQWEGLAVREDPR